MDYRQAIKSTISYASFFDFPLFPEEIHYWLISDHPVSLNKIKKILPQTISPSEQKKRQTLLETSTAKIDLAHRLVKVLKHLPGLRLIGLTGSVAAKNSKSKDDIDLLIITSPHTLWLVRPVVLFLISLFFRRRHPEEDPARATDAFCPNLWLDTLALSVPKSKRNLYTAHEVLQVQPIFDKHETYQLFLYQNRWAKKYLANAYTSLASGSVKKQKMEISSIFLPLNLIFFFLQFLYMSSKKTSEVVHLHAAFLHTVNFSEQLDRFLGRS